MSAPVFTAEPLSQIAPTPVRWLWEPYLPRGKLAILDGDPGIGKSLVAIDLAARLSRGGTLPDGSPAGRPHVALLFVGEDGVEDTLRPRAEAAGADLDRVRNVSGTGNSLMTFPAEVGRLEGMIRLFAADLVVIDPMMAFLSPGVQTNADRSIRGVLRLLADVAARTDCAILLLRHLRKRAGGKALYRGLGSVGIIGSVRTGLLLAGSPATPGLRVLAVTKSNLARTPPALGLRLTGESAALARVEWVGPVEATVDGVEVPTARPLHARDRAGDWLLRQLAGGPRRVPELLAAAAEVGIPEKTLNRAKAEVRVSAVRAYIGPKVAGVPREQQWFWFDPDAPWPATAPFPKPYATETPRM